MELDLKKWLDYIIKVLTQIGKCILRKRKGVKDYETLCNILWSQTDPNIIINEKLKNQLSNLIIYHLGKDVKNIIIQGVGGFGKTTAINILNKNFKILADFKKHSDNMLNDSECRFIYFDYKNEKNLIDLKLRSYDINRDILVIDNYREFTITDLNEINFYHDSIGKIIICRKCNIIPQNKSTKIINCSKLPYKISKKHFNKTQGLVNPNINKLSKKQFKTFKKLPNSLQIPLFADLIQSIDDRKILDTLKRKYVRTKNTEAVIEELVNIVLSYKKDSKKIPVLIFYAMVCSDMVYDKDIIKEIIPKELYLAINTMIINSTFLQGLKKNHRNFENSSEIFSLSLHSVFYDYIIKHTKDYYCKDFWNNGILKFIINNINIKLETGIGAPMEDKIKYLPYAKNIIDFFKSTLNKENVYLLDINLIKDLLNMINSYTNIYVKVFNGMINLNYVIKNHEVLSLKYSRQTH